MLFLLTIVIMEERKNGANVLIFEVKYFTFYWKHSIVYFSFLIIFMHFESKKITYLLLIN